MGKNCVIFWGHPSGPTWRYYVLQIYDVLITACVAFTHSQFLGTLFSELSRIAVIKQAWLSRGCGASKFL